MENFYVYRYSNPASGEPFYIGKGKGERAWSHLKRKDQHHLTHKIQKMLREGVLPDIDFIVSEVDEELANLVEQEAISKYGRLNLRTGLLLNLTNGGDGTSGRIATPEMLANMSKGRKGIKDTEQGRANKKAASLRREYTAERNANVSKGLQGHITTDETKEILSQKAKDRYTSGAPNPMTGRTQTVEAKARIGAKNKAHHAAKRLAKLGVI
jgi:hypothetical protein